MDYYYNFREEPLLYNLYNPPKQIKYNSIKNFDKRNKLYDDMMIIFTEKIHGSNICVTIVNELIFIYKRNNLLTPDENHYNSYNVVNSISNNLFKLVNNLKKTDSDIIRIYGEIYGGDYNGETEKGHTFVQKNMNYCPFNSLDIFDISIESNDEICYLDWDNLVMLTENFNLRHVPEIMRCTMIEFNNKIDINKLKTVIPSTHNLNNNNSRCEGVVARLLNPTKDSQGIICKIKSSWASETPLTKPKNNINLNYLVEFYNDNRLEAFISKMGPDFICQKNRGVIISEIYNDILVDFKLDNEYIKLPNKVKDKLKKQICSKINIDLKNHLN